jgi:hypothetical protein
MKRIKAKGIEVSFMNRRLRAEFFNSVSQGFEAVQAGG